ncbi:fibronectin type III domain-containing protein [Leifsonia sp. AG29]|uniref:fibronectin type III domain-containing protein n=1 Tax=Leifsonia sp. AG29 TaxID=2598860 RepID=UPI00131CC2FB|nr:fibronectin type III domain-containing protein [Leifsonia sp. AG29]
MNRLGLRSPVSRALPARRVRHGRLALAALAAGAATFLLLPGGGSYALWNGASTAKAGTLTAATVSVTETIAQPLSPVFKTGSTTTTGAVVVTNTSNVGTAFRSSVGLAPAGSAPLSAAITASLWPVSSAASCTPSAVVPPGAFTGSLAAMAATPLIAGTLAAGATFTFCLRESMNVASATGIASGSSVGLALSATVTAGQVWSSTATAAVSQTFVDDLAPSAPTGLIARTTAATPVALTWTASIDNVGVAAYDVYRSGTPGPIGSTAVPTFTDSGAAANTSYTYTVYARDAAGLISAGSTLFVDRTPPGQPSLTLTGSTSTSASLSFSATDNVGVTAYTVYRDGVAIATVAAPAASYTDTALPIGAHRYTVTANDAAGNVSTPSAAVTATGSYRSGSWYQIVNAASGQCVTAPTPITNGGALTQAACASPLSDAQAWLVTTSGTGVTVTAALPLPTSSQYLWAGSRTAPVSVTSTGAASNGSTLWTFTLQSDSTFSLGNTITGDSGNGNGNGWGNVTTLCATASASGGGQLTTATCAAGTATQSFTLRPVTP